MFRPITFADEDTLQTRREIHKHNTKYDAFCKADERSQIASPIGQLLTSPLADEHLGTIHQ